MTEISSEARKVLQEATQHDGTPPVSDQALVAVSQGKRELIEFEGKAVGIIGEGELDLVVRPSSRGRGLGRKALQQLLEAWNPSASDELRTWAHGDNAAADTLLRENGFVPVRTLLRMTLEPELLPRAIAEARPLPDGFEVRPFDADQQAGVDRQAGVDQQARDDSNPAQRSQADDWVRVNAAAFVDHPEQGTMTRDDFDALTKEPWFAADDLRLAYAPSGELAAFAWVKTTRTAPNEAAEHDVAEHDVAATETELYALGAAPEFAGRGLGAAMLGETLRRMATHDPDRITLYVEGDNTAALPLYERAGFKVEQSSTQWLLRA